MIQYSTRLISKMLCDIHLSLKLFPYDVKQMTVVIDERMKCETLKEHRKISLHESQISRPRKNLCPFSGWQEIATKFDTVSCTLLPAANFNLGHYPHGRILLEEFVGTADNLPATSPYLFKPASEQTYIFTTTLIYRWAYVVLPRRMWLNVKRCALHKREDNLNSSVCHK